VDDIVYLPTVGLWAVFIILYLIRCRQTRKTPNLALVINAVLLSGGVATGVVLIASTFDGELQAKLTSIKSYVFVAGVAVVFVCGQALYRELFGDSDR
jgi:hypothetical protein